MWPFVRVGTTAITTTNSSAMVARGVGKTRLQQSTSTHSGAGGKVTLYVSDVEKTTMTPPTRKRTIDNSSSAPPLLAVRMHPVSPWAPRPRRPTPRPATPTHAQIHFNGFIACCPCPIGSHRLVCRLVRVVSCSAFPCPMACTSCQQNKPRVL